MDTQEMDPQFVETATWHRPDPEVEALKTPSLVSLVSIEPPVFYNAAVAARLVETIVHPYVKTPEVCEIMAQNSENTLRLHVVYSVYKTATGFKISITSE